MTIFQAIILGVIQGFTEFLPVSSSGHLIFFPKLFGWVDQGLAFDVVMHLGTLLAVLVYFRKKLFSILLSFFQNGKDSAVNRRLGWLLCLSIVPAGLVGFFGEQWIEQNTRSVNFIAFGLIFWGLVLFAADRYNQKMPKEELVDMSHLNAKKIATVAIAQAVALFPGTSRSGITMTAGLFSKIDKKSAAELSFLMSVPIIVIAGGQKIVELFSVGWGNLTPTPVFSGFVASAVSGLLAITALLKIIERWSFTPFVVYRIALGLFILFLL